ncbi:MAG: hypothetical protein GX442_07120 [Candidatus Riflebacteria bacterium]|nr:hypothetical protein [Candidatus Riflebacteria bacterium]
MNLAARLREMTGEMLAALDGPDRAGSPRDGPGPDGPGAAPVRSAAPRASDFAGLDRLGVCTGPGSLTGLRVALSFFRAIALARGLPLVGLDLFTWGAHTLAAQGRTGPVRLLAPAFLDQAFAADLILPLAPYDLPAPFLAPRAAAPDGRPAWGLRFAAEGAERLDPDPAVLHRLMGELPAPVGPAALQQVAPLYVVPSQAELKWMQTHDHAGH